MATAAVNHTKLTRDIFVDNFEMLNHQLLIDRSNKLTSCERYASIEVRKNKNISIVLVRRICTGFYVDISNNNLTSLSFLSLSQKL